MTLTPEATRLMSNIRVHAPAALDNAIRLELFNVLSQFCKETNYWQEQVDYTTVPGTTAYTLAVTEPGQPIRLLNNTNALGSRVAATMALPGEVVLATEPSDVQVFTATVSLTVVDPVDADEMPEIPDSLLLEYGEGIRAGVVGALMAQPAKPYTNERMGIYNTRVFRGAIANARSAVLHKNIQGGQTWRFPSNFKSGSQR